MKPVRLICIALALLCLALPAVAQTNRLAPIVDFTFQNGTNRFIGPVTAKALGLGTEKIPSMQILADSRDHSTIYQFGVSLQNSNDILVARINRETRSGIIWLTSPGGVVRATFLTSTNGSLVPAPSGSYANKFAEVINTLLQFVTPPPSKGSPPWQGDPHPLNVAAMYGGVPDVEKILQRDPGAINAQDDEGMTPLAGAVVREQIGVMTFLLDHGADPNIPNMHGLTPLEQACGHDKGSSVVLAQLLLGAGANVNATDGDGETALHKAAYYGNSDVIEILLAHGASINATNKMGGTPLQVAGKPEIAELLRQHGAK
jgi:Ankyrin repeats (many copies)